jgi:hypothetical protein
MPLEFSAVPGEHPQDEVWAAKAPGGHQVIIRREPFDPGYHWLIQDREGTPIDASIGTYDSRELAEASLPRWARDDEATTSVGALAKAAREALARYVRRKGSA